MKPHFLTAFILLSLATILLLGFSIQFFTSAPVQMQLNAWIREGQSGTTARQNARKAPRQSQQPFVAAIPAARKTPHPTATPIPLQPLLEEPAAIQVSLDPVEDPTRMEPTPLPVFQVAEEIPPEGNLVIPSLGIDQPLVPVIVREQEWDLTNLGSQVGWLQTTGTHPGDDQAMVLIGHITLPHPGGVGPFLNLNSLKPGDVIKYRNGQITYAYQVKGKSVVRPEMVETLYQSDGNSLLLVTCTGYNAIERAYNRRLVVEAVLVAVENGRSIHFDSIE